MQESPPSFANLDGAAVDLLERTVTRSGKVHRLTTKEAALLTYLMSRPNQPLSRETLKKEVWGYATSAMTRTMDLCVMRLRQKLEAEPQNPRVLITETGLGYRLVVRPGDTLEPAIAPQAAPGPTPVVAARTAEQEALGLWLDDDPEAAALAARRSDSVSASDLLALLDHGVHAALGDARRGAQEAARIEALPSDLRPAFERLAWFATSFDLSAAAALLESPSHAAIGVLETLGNLAVLTRVPGPRFRVPWALRCEARRLSGNRGAGWLHDVWHTHANWVATQPARDVALDLREALRHTQKDGEAAARLVTQALEAEQGVYWMRFADEAGTALLKGGALAPSGEWRVRIASASRWLALGQTDLAKRDLELADQMEDTRTPTEFRFRTRLELSLLMAEGDWVTVIDRSPAAIREAAAAGDVLDECRVLGRRGMAYARLGQRDGAQQDFERVYRLMGPLPVSRAKVAASIGLMMLHGPNHPTVALRFAEEAVALATSTKDPILLAEIQATVGNLYLECSDIPSAARCLASAVEHYRRADQLAGLSRASFGLAGVEILCGNLDAARQHLADATLLETRSPNPVLRASIPHLNGVLAELDGQREDARIQFERALGALAADNPRRFVVTLHMAVLAAHSGDLEGARTLLAEAPGGEARALRPSQTLASWFINGRAGPMPSGGDPHLRVVVVRAATDAS